MPREAVMCAVHAIGQGLSLAKQDPLPRAKTSNHPVCKRSLGIEISLGFT